MLHVGRPVTNSGGHAFQNRSVDIDRSACRMSWPINMCSPSCKPCYHSARILITHICMNTSFKYGCNITASKGRLQQCTRADAIFGICVHLTQVKKLEADTVIHTRSHWRTRSAWASTRQCGNHEFMYVNMWRTKTITRQRNDSGMWSQTWN